MSERFRPSSSQPLRLARTISRGGSSIAKFSLSLATTSTRQKRLMALTYIRDARCSRAVPAATVSPALRTAVERALRERQVQFLVIDEAAHSIHQTRYSSKLGIQFDTLKSLVNQCGTQIVLAGPYDLCPLMSLSGQLARRSPTGKPSICESSTLAHPRKFWGASATSYTCFRRSRRRSA
nr:AAA family ATPase [Burkholderia ambifaria]